jgi:hypothetical protein
MLRLFVCSTIFAAALAVVACDPYNPDLGETPYRCGSEEPKCPDGYDPVQVSPPNLCECHRHGTDGGGDTPDAGGPLTCSSDPKEPNDTPASATPTSIGTGAFTAVFSNQSICSTTDVDTYLFTTTQPNQTMKATVSYLPTEGQPFVRLVNAQNTPMGEMGTPSGQNMLVATVVVPTQGTYYVQVGSVVGMGTYGLSLVLE